MATDSADPPLHEMLTPVAWLLGKWQSETAVAKYPTMKGDFPFGEELEFTHIGQPHMHLSLTSWHGETKKILHRESGFLRIKPNSNHVALMIAMNLGLSTMEEGEVSGQEMKTETHTIARLSFGKEPATKKISRVFTRTGDKLEHVVHMTTDRTPHTEHLHITYNKVEYDD